MRTVIKSKIYVYGASLDLVMWCRDNLIVTNPTWATLTRIGKQDTIQRKHISPEMKLYAENGCDLILPFGVLYAIWPFIKNDPYELKLNDNGIVIDRQTPSLQPLYDYQQEAVAQMVAAKGGVLEGACGCGKTQIGINIAKTIGRNTLWLCHTGDLLRQTVKRIHMLYPHIAVGTITEGEFGAVRNGITVATVQTLINVDSELYKDMFDVVITDECHHVSGSPTLSKMHSTILGKIPARYKFGLSATLTRSDTMIKSMYVNVGCALDGSFAPVWKIAKNKTNTLIAEHKRIDLDTPFDYECLNEDGTFNYPALIEFLGQYPARNQVIVDNVIKNIETHPKQLVLCARIEQCELINEMLQDQGVNSVLLVGKVSKKKREEILFGNKNWNCIVATLSLAKEGLDVPELSALHWAMVISDKVATVQSAGRIERVSEGKPAPVIFDYVDVNYPYCLGKWKKRAGWLKRR